VVGKLTALKVARISKPGMVGDGDGLWLRVSSSGARSWILRYMVQGRARGMGLGSAKTLGLADARQLAHEARRQILLDVDPIDTRKAARAAKATAAAHSVTFRACALLYLEAHADGWRNKRSRGQWEAAMETYVFPIIGELPVSQIDTGSVMRVLAPIWKVIPETASRIRGRLERVLNLAKARGYRAGDNPAAWVANLDNLLQAQPRSKRTTHFPAMPYTDVPQFMYELRAKDSISARALEFLVLTALRTSEVLGMRWSEVDLGQKLLTIPGSRTKSARPHRAPLSDRAVELLRSLPRERDGEFVFPGAREGRPLSNMSLLELLRGMRPGGDAVCHGFRSSFRMFAAERTNFSHETAEIALAHVVEDATAAAYMRSDLLAKRAKLMQAWSTYCSSPPSTGKILPLRKAR
jgi:integrase